jgi:GNAT superfamily N-acetyltransferase
MNNIFHIQNEHDLERAYPVLKELRQHLSYQEYKNIYYQAKLADGYELIAVESEGEIIALMGLRYLSDFVRGRHLYIDDLISTQKVRSQGIGKILLDYAEELARNSNCTTLRLCTGIENDRGIKFYERNGWVKRALAYTKKLS